MLHPLPFPELMRRGRYSYQLAGVRLVDLAEGLGMSPAYCSRILQGQLPPPRWFRTKALRLLAQSKAHAGA